VLGEREGPPGPARPDTEPRDSVGQQQHSFEYIVSMEVIMKKGNIMFVLFFFTFICFKEEVVAETVEEPFFSDEKIELSDDFSGDYFFSSIDMEEIDESEHIDLSPYEDLNENIYIKIVKLDSDKYKMESNFWLLMEQINLETVFNGFPYHLSMDEFRPPLIHEYSALNRKTDLQIYCHENDIVIDYSYEDSRLERVHIIETTDMIIKREGSVTSTTTTSQPYYSPDKVMIKYKMFFQKNN
jgi:hypothetical protein